MAAHHDDQADDRQLCLIGSREHRAHDGMLICAGHAQALATMLRDIEDQTALLDPRKSMAVSSGGKGGTLASQQSPVRLDALVLTDTRHAATWRQRPEYRDPRTADDPLALDDTPQVLDVLGSWARLVREDRHLSAPAGPALITRERDLLTRQLPWIVTQPWVADLHDELRELQAVLQRANGTHDVPAGRCTTLQAEGTECGGTIRHVEIHHDGGPDEPGFRCGRCRRVWTGTEAVRLRHQLWLDEQGQAATA